MLPFRVFAATHPHRSPLSRRSFPLPSLLSLFTVVHPLPVQLLTKCSSRNSFVLKTIHFDGGVYESVWQLGLTLPLYCQERSTGWPIFWSTTRSKLTCCHQPCEQCWEKGIFAFSCIVRWRSWICRSLKQVIATKGIRPIIRRSC